MLLFTKNMKHKRLLVLLIRNALITYIGVNILYLTFSWGFYRGQKHVPRKRWWPTNCFVSLKKTYKEDNVKSYQQRSSIENSFKNWCFFFNQRHSKYWKQTFKTIQYCKWVKYKVLLIKKYTMNSNIPKNTIMDTINI